jgi:hypothetical protein
MVQQMHMGQISWVIKLGFEHFNSNFMGVNAGYSAINAESSNFIGNNAGFSSISAYNSNFIGSAAGYNASGAYSSNFFGQAGSGNMGSIKFLGSSSW